MVSTVPEFFCSSWVRFRASHESRACREVKDYTLLYICTTSVLADEAFWTCCLSLCLLLEVQKRYTADATNQCQSRSDAPAQHGGLGRLNQTEIKYDEVWLAASNCLFGSKYRKSLYMISHTLWLRPENSFRLALVAPEAQQHASIMFQRKLMH